MNLKDQDSLNKKVLKVIRTMKSMHQTGRKSTTKKSEKKKSIALCMHELDDMITDLQEENFSLRLLLKQKNEQMDKILNHIKQFKEAIPSLEVIILENNDEEDEWN